MKKPKQSIKQQLAPLGAVVFRYKKFIFAIGVLLAISFLVFRINQFTSVEPSQQQIDDRLQTVARPKLDPALLDRIQQLKDQNVEVQSLFDQSRDNPFNE